MQIKKDISSTRIFYLSILSSILLFLSIMFGQKLASELSIFAFLIEIPIILLFIATTIVSIIFWVRNYSKYDFAFLPTVINILILGLIIILPLNQIRNRIEFAIFKNQYEEAVNYVISTQTEETKHLKTFHLPAKYKKLSVGGGDAIVFNRDDYKGVFFYTYRGLPDGRIGFLKIIGNEKIDDFIKIYFNKVNKIKSLGDNWYFISGE